MEVIPPAPDWAVADQPNYMQAYGSRLRTQGYSILPIMPGTKKPGRFDTNEGWVSMSDWARYLDHPATAWETSTWSSWPGCGVGVLCGAPKGGEGVILIDIDVLDHEVSSAVQSVIEQSLGKSPAIRIGKWPKAGVVYRVDEQWRKIDRKPIEVLGLGQQFLAYATHPDTKKAYDWVLEQLVNIPLASLPLVTEAAVREAVEDALEHVPDEMKPIRLATSDGEPVQRSSAGQRGTDEAVVAALGFIPNPELSWDDWNRIGMAAWAATEGSQAGFAAFDEWSQQSVRYDARETLSRWRHYRTSPPTQIGAGTLYELAGRHGWVPAAEVALNPSKRPEGVDISVLMERGARVAEPATVVAIAAATQPERAPMLPAAAPAEARSIPKADAAAFPREWLETTSLVGDIVRYVLSTSIRPQPTFALFNALCALGAVYGRRYRSKWFDTRCNMMCVVIAGPGGGKDHSRKAIKRLMTDAGLAHLIAGDSYTSGVAIIKVLAEFPSRVAHMDEMGLFLQSIAMKNASPHQRGVIKTLLEVFSSSGGTFHGQEYASSEQDRIDIINPNFNLFGSTTPKSLVPAMSRSMADNGTMSRLLLVPSLDDYPEPQAPSGDGAPSAELIAKLSTSWHIQPVGAGNIANQQNIKESRQTLIDVIWADGVMEQYKALEDVVTERGRAERYVWTRCAELTIKIAMIEAIALNPVQPVITPAIFAMAWRLVRWCLDYSERLMSEEVAENETEANHKSVLRFIRGAGPAGVDKSKLTRRFQSIKSREREEILQALMEGGDVRVRAEKADPKGPGRMKTTYYAA